MIIKSIVTGNFNLNKLFIRLDLTFYNAKVLF